MYQVLTILICLAKKLLFWFVDRDRSDSKTAEDTPYQPPRNEEIDSLKERKREIESTIEELNTPSTFAKYSKMKRQLLKIERQIEQLVKKHEQESAINKKQYEEGLKLNKQHKEQQKKTQAYKRLIIRTLVNVILSKMLWSYYSQSIELGQTWPLNWFFNEGRVSCGLIFIAATYLIG